MSESGKRIWVATTSGGGVDLLDPKPEQVRLHDLAWGLSRLPRFNGQTISGSSYSVARHSTLVVELMPDDACPRERLWALLHDGHEYCVGDIASPVLRAMKAVDGRMARDVSKAGWMSQFDALSTITLELDRAIRLAFGLPEFLPEPWMRRVRDADLLALALERHALMHASSPDGFEWDPLPQVPDVLSDRIRHLLAPDSAQADYDGFMAAFESLSRKRHAIGA